MRWLWPLLVLGLVSCGGTPPPEVENPYAARAKSFASEGVFAMQRERYEFAVSLFERGLAAAQLADDAELIVQAWYGLGQARKALGRRQPAREALERALELARSSRLETFRVRARLALAVLDAEAGKAAWRPAPLPRRFPADVHLSAAHLARLQGRLDAAREEYGAALRFDAERRDVMLTRARARLGLAMLDEAQGETERARREVGLALRLCREVGAPRLAAEALLLSARLRAEADERVALLERARRIFALLEDPDGRRRALEALAAAAGDAGDAGAAARYRRELEELSATGEMSGRGGKTE